jgi:curli biogenesis system outer membrane secretion channel CsgG
MVRSKFALFTATLIAVALIVASGADAQIRKKKPLIDKSDAQATSEAPVSAQVEEIALPYNPNLPTFVFLIEPFDYSASGQTSGGGQDAPSGSVAAGGEANYVMTEDGNLRTTWSSSYGPSIGNGISKQLMTALGRWGNVSIIEPEAVKDNGDGTYSCKMLDGEVGPFIVKGTVTEFSETAEMEGSRKGFNSRGLGVGTAIIGGITGNRTAAAVGTGVAVAGPEYQKEEMNRTGMVGMDLRIVDGRIARAVRGGTFDCQGTFTSISAGTDFGMLGFSSGRSASASSSLGQATRAAMNDAVQKIHDVMQSVR